MFTTQSTSAHVTGQGGVRTKGGTRCRGRGRVRTCGGRYNVAPNVSPDWYQNGQTKKRCFNFVGDPGVKVVLADTTSSLSVFKIFFSDKLIQYIVRATSTYAEIIISSPHVQERLENTKKRLLKLWKPESLDEMWVYIAVILTMCIIKKPQYSLHWSKNHLFNTTIFPRLMRCNHCVRIRQMLHFLYPKAEEQNDTLQKLRIMINYLIERFKGNYILEKNIAVDEYLSLWKSHLSFRIYIPTKRERYGVKLFMLCERNTGYHSNFIICTGATINYTAPLANLPMPFDDYKNLSKVVLSLMNDFIRCGYWLTLGNYYTLPEIAETLLSLETDSNGTLKKKQNLPHDF